MDALDSIADDIRDTMSAINSARDAALATSRSLIRACAQSIRAAHREDVTAARAKLEEAEALASELRAATADYPALYHTGYTQDALKELVEAHLVLAFITDGPIPSHTELGVEGATYLRGLAEASTEMRRRILDIIRHEGQLAEGERLLTLMDDIYTLLITFDFPDSVTYGLRRQTDTVRGVLERTRGDLTLSQRQRELQRALATMEARLNPGDAND